MNITQFKAEDDSRLWLNSLFDLGGYLGASNGQFLVIDLTTKSKFFGFSKLEDHIEPKSSQKLKNNIKSIIEKEASFNWQEMPSIPKDLYHDCDYCDQNGKEVVRGNKCIECNGEGVVSFDTEHNSYECHCKSCDGHGDIITGKRVCSICQGTKKHLRFSSIVENDLGNSDWCISAQNVQKFSTLKDCKIAWVEEWEKYAVRFKDGVAIIFPMRR